ncbi:hypothetical protein TWF569_000138 [Orbilia oligospora]|uniref:Uncharacterized protein n=1 Tax=Orbilia oligospora TaxID=2813651 RepID=A0A7C8NEU7_ORBOL|nr:hypothetical protein TWF102_003055 [Orbilia oligospora]KAF3109368.1 hypothetical protein TWF103_005242 [Orbilia oligospora]KAF3112237.1 hypothetical protein TWF706_010828 [Orbilia oligospora]KAF3150539.1 hypothetical protein TWF594_009182 [Orbilia oligospora]KAF3157573.1 hypothetical protein TWF569_000138 [Orbilia oligospora]
MMVGVALGKSGNPGGVVGELTNKKIVEEKRTNHQCIKNNQEKYEAVLKRGRAQSLEAVMDAGQKRCRGRAGLPLAENRCGDAMGDNRRQNRRPGARAQLKTSEVCISRHRFPENDNIKCQWPREDRQT